jgi:hypothetical protein
MRLHVNMLGSSHVATGRYACTDVRTCRYCRFRGIGMLVTWRLENMHRAASLGLRLQSPGNGKVLC